MIEMNEHGAKARVDSDNIGHILPRLTAAINKAIWAGPLDVVLKRPKRSSSQNAKLWPMLRDVSRQVDWHGHTLSDEEWKHVFLASLFRQRAVPGIDGGFVVLGGSSSALGKGQFSELIELVYAFGLQQGVVFSEPSLQAYQEFKEAA